MNLQVWITGIFVFLFGAVIGSFLNVCIYRLPQNLSLNSPGSFCPSCKYHIPFYDNIPILSYLLLLGHCRNCRSRISPLYPFVEFLNAFLYLLLFLKFQLSREFFFYAPFTSAFIALFFIDWKNKILPDVITISGIIFGLGLAPFLESPGILDSLLGAVSGFLLFFLVAFIYEKITGREGMGGGDIKMIAMTGAFLGLKGVIATIFISSLIGALFGLFLIIFFKKDFRYAVPFGCFIALGGLIFLFAGEDISYLYFKLIGIYG